MSTVEQVNNLITSKSLILLYEDEVTKRGLWFNVLVTLPLSILGLTILLLKEVVKIDETNNVVVEIVVVILVCVILPIVVGITYSLHIKNRDEDLRFLRRIIDEAVFFEEKYGDLYDEEIAKSDDKEENKK